MANELSPALPVIAGNNIYSTGMTLRDWFAGQALIGIVARGKTLGVVDSARDAYLIADAMLKVRKEL